MPRLLQGDETPSPDAGHSGASGGSPLADRLPDAKDLFEEAPVGYLLLGADGTILRINRAGARLLGWSAEWLCGRPLVRWVNSSDRPDFLSYLRRLQKPSRRRSQPLRLKSREGRSLRVRLVGSPCAPPDGALRVVLTDLSGEDRSARRMRRLQAELEHVARLHTAGEMATSLAHELNQPLGTVMLNCEAALRLLGADGKADEGADEGVGTAKDYELTDALTQAIQAASFASEVVRHLRSFLGKGSHERWKVRPAAMLRELATLIGMDAHDHDVQLTLDIPRGLPELRVNEVQIKQVLLNLSRNAIEAVNQQNNGGPREIAVSAQTDGTRAIRFCVEDSGPGIDARGAERLFAPFYSTKSQGMGMGLAISRSIVEAHGGRLWAEPRAEGGTRFCFSLPLGEETEDAD